MSEPRYAQDTYFVEVTDHGLCESKTNKTPQIFIKFKVLGAVSKEDPEQYYQDDDQQERTYYRAVTDKTLPYLKEDFESLGFEGSFSDFDCSAGSFDLRGSTLKMRVKHEVYNGNTQERWSIARAGGDVARLDQDAVAKLDSLFGRDLKAKDKKTTKPAAGPKPTDRGAPRQAPIAKEQEEQGLPEDGIPF